nr:MAG TPA: hypothetical protein [Bacteriophage sp.]
MTDFSQSKHKLLYFHLCTSIQNYTLLRTDNVRNTFAQINTQSFK